MGRVMLSPAGQSHFLSTLDAGWMEGRGCRFEVDGGLPVSRVRGWAGRGEVVDGSRGRRDRRLCERSRKLMVRFVENTRSRGLPRFADFVRRCRIQCGERRGSHSQQKVARDLRVHGDPRVMRPVKYAERRSSHLGPPELHLPPWKQ